MKHLKKYEQVRQISDEDIWRESKWKSNLPSEHSKEYNNLMKKKQWCLLTESESSEYYFYFIESRNKPTIEELREFLKTNAHEEDNEFVVRCVEIKDFKEL